MYVMSEYLATAPCFLPFCSHDQSLLLLKFKILIKFTVIMYMQPFVWCNKENSYNLPTSFAISHLFVSQSKLERSNKG